MADWYDKALEEFIEEASTYLKVSPEKFTEIYGYLSNIGLVDYDIEKEYLYDNFSDEEETTDE